MGSQFDELTVKSYQKTGLSGAIWPGGSRAEKVSWFPVPMTHRYETI